MNRFLLVLILSLGSRIATAQLSTTASPKEASGAQWKSALKPSFGFEPNLGQTDGSVQFVSKLHGNAVFLTRQGAVLAPRGEGKPVRMTLLGSNPAAKVTGIDALPSVANYFTGSDPAKWATGVPRF